MIKHCAGYGNCHLDSRSNLRGIVRLSLHIGKKVFRTALSLTACQLQLVALETLWMYTFCRKKGDDIKFFCLFLLVMSQDILLDLIVYCSTAMYE